MKKAFLLLVLALVGFSAAALDTTQNDAFWDTRNYPNAAATSEQAGAETSLSIDTWVKDVVTSTIPGWFSSFKRGLMLLFK